MPTSSFAVISGESASSCDEWIRHEIAAMPPYFFVTCFSRRKESRAWSGRSPPFHGATGGTSDLDDSAIDTSASSTTSTPSRRGN